MTATAAPALSRRKLTYGIRAEQRARIETETQKMWAWYTQIRERTLADVAEKFGLRPSTVAARFHDRGLLAHGPQRLPRVCRHCGYRHPANTGCTECGRPEETAPQQEIAA